MNLRRKVLGSLVVSSVATLCALSAPARAQSSACPDERATNVPKHVVNVGPVDLCYRYLTLFGIKIAVGSLKCPTTVLLHPSHRVCEGAKNSETRCIAAGVVKELRQRCSCTDAEFGVLGNTAEHCRCSDWVATGSIQDHDTVECTPDARPRSAQASGGA